MQPSEVLAIDLAVSEAAVEDADQTVTESAQSLMMCLAAGAEDVVTMPGAFGASEG